MLDSKSASFIGSAYSKYFSQRKKARYMQAGCGGEAVQETKETKAKLREIQEKPVTVVMIHGPSTAQKRYQNMLEYIKRLKLCLRQFQEVEMIYLSKHERLTVSLKIAKQKVAEIGMLSLEK